MTTTATRLLDATPVVVKPALKWAGGKSWLVPFIAQNIREYLEEFGGTYYEPFLGGAAIALAVGGSRLILSDLSDPLINFYRCLREDPILLRDELGDLIEVHGVDEAGYKRVKDRWNGDGFLVWRRAAAFFYFNKLGYNGLWRVNGKGGFNVPRGRYKLPANPLDHWPTLDHLQAVSRILQPARLLCVGFQTPIREAKAGDVVFSDQPYEGGGGFDMYTKERFPEDAHAELAQCLTEAAERGVAVICTCSEASRSRYSPDVFVIKSTLEARAVNSDGKKRGGAPCLLIVSAEHEGLIGGDR